jgi:predicted HTH domain antitoxin
MPLPKCRLSWIEVQLIARLACLHPSKEGYQWETNSEMSCKMDATPVCFRKLNIMVEVTLSITDAVAAEFGGDPNAVGRQLLEAAALEGYRSERLSRGQVRELLGLSWHETEQFLADHECFRHYTLEDLEEDRRTLANLPAR